MSDKELAELEADQARWARLVRRAEALRRRRLGLAPVVGAGWFPWR